MLQLTAEEQTWLDAYRAALNEKQPGAVQEMLIYGSKARGQARADSDLDVLLVTKNDANALKRELRWIGYLLAAKTDVLRAEALVGSDPANSLIYQRKVGTKGVV
jgi:predicted nucleotidyltransferase